MKSIFASSLVTLGLLVMGAAAQEGQWKPAAPRSPIPTPAGTSAAVKLLRPVPLTESAAPGTIQRVTFSTDGLPAVIARGKNGDPPQPLPTGPTGPLTADDLSKAANPQVWGGAPPPAVLNPAPIYPGPMSGGTVPLSPGVGLPPGAVVVDGAGVGQGAECGPGCPMPCADGCCGLLGKAGDWFHNLSNGCCGLGNCCQLPHFWGSAEYLLWTVRSPNTPALVAAAPSGVAPDLVTGTPVYAGGVNQGVFSGGRFTAGFTLGSMPNLGFEGSYFFLGRQTNNSFFGSDGLPGSPNLGRPVYTPTGAPDAELVSATGALSGIVGVQTSTELWGAEGNLKRRLLCGCNGFLDVLGGFRYLNLREDLQISERLMTLVPTPLVPAGSQTVVFDEFRTSNQFYGGQLGVAGEYRLWKNFFVGGSFKLALGDMHEQLEIKGNTTFLVPGFAPATGTGGLLAQPSNIGNYSSDHFAVMPELGLKVGYNFTPNIRAFVGYDLLYVSNVVRPGDQVDLVVNRSQAPMFLPPGAVNPPLVGIPRPRPLFQTTDFWAQGVNFGLEFRY